jgi:hypothetical protein
MAQSGQPLTNADIVLMVTNKIDEKIILTTIDSAEQTAFDTTANGLLTLRKPDSKTTVRDKLVLEVQKVAAQKQPRLVLKNTDVLTMVAGGLSGEIVRAAIDTAGSTAFDMSPRGLVDLKAGGVSDDIARHMQELTIGRAGPPSMPVAPAPAGPAPAVPAPGAAAPTVPTKTSAAAGPTAPPKPATPVATQPISSNEASKPHDAGIYVGSGGHLEQLRISVVTQAGVSGSGKFMNSLVGKSVTMDAKFSDKPKAEMRISASAEFRFYGRSDYDPNLYALVKVYASPSGRVIHAGRAGGFSGVKNGIEQKDMVAVDVSGAEGGSYRVVPKSPLLAGEYAFINIADNNSKKVWDFGVDEP